MHNVHARLFGFCLSSFNLLHTFTYVYQPEEDGNKNEHMRTIQSNDVVNDRPCPSTASRRPRPIIQLVLCNHYVHSPMILRQYSRLPCSFSPKQCICIRPYGADTALLESAPPQRPDDTQTHHGLLATHCRSVLQFRILPPPALIQASASVPKTLDATHPPALYAVCCMPCPV